jgi:hypothetical protein
VLDKTALSEGLMYLDLIQGNEKYVGKNRIMENCVLFTLLQRGCEWVTKTRKMKWSRLAALMVKAINGFVFAKFVKKRRRTWETRTQTTL